MASERPPQDSSRTSRQVLEPIERLSEVLFGLIMVLTFTGSLSVASADAEVTEMLVGALGCNIAWGIIDGVLYLMACLNDQGRGIRALRALRAAATPREAHATISAALPPLLGATLGAAELEPLRRKLAELPEPPRHPRLGKDEWLGALGVFFWVFVTTFPVAIPFLFMQDVLPAMRVSNTIAVVLLFIVGYAFGRVAEYHPWRTGLAMVVLGGVLVAMTMALGG